MWRPNKSQNVFDKLPHKVLELTHKGKSPQTGRRRKMDQVTISGNVTINGKAMWTVEGVMANGDVSIYRYVDTKNSRRLISRRISPLKLKKWGN
jgi:hypothetical protein